MCRIVALRRFDMRLDANLVNADPTVAALVPDGVTLNDILHLFCTAQGNGKQLIDRRLSALGVTDPANIALPTLPQFIKWLLAGLKSAGVKDPAAVLAHGVKLEAEAATAKLGTSAEISNIAAQPNSTRQTPVTIQNNSSATSVALPARQTGPRTAETTKTELLSRVKAAIEAGKGRRYIADGLAFAREHFHASQREIGRAIARDPSWVNRMLKWHQNGYKQSSPFGPTTRSGRAAGRKSNNNDLRGGGSSNGLPIGAAATGPTREVSSSDTRDDGSENVGISQTDRCSASCQSPPIPQSGNEDFSGRSVQMELSPNEIDAGESEKYQTTTLEDPNRQRDLSDDGPLEEQKRPPENVKANQMRSPERMRVVVDSLKEHPVLARAALKAGIHRKTLANWLKDSKAGHEGYDIECEGETYRFHDLCDFAIADAHDTLHFNVRQIAMGIRYKIDPLLEKRGYRGIDAYATDANGNFIEEGIRKPNPKMMRFYLEWKLPERYGKPRKKNIARTGGVLIVGERSKRPKASYEASIRARQWKAVSRKI
jgi:hypothetical protein